MVTLLVTATAAAGSAPSCYSRLVNEWVCGAYLVDRKDQLISATVQHLQITAAAVLLGLLIAVPLALLARRFSRQTFDRLVLVVLCLLALSIIVRTLT